MWWWPVAISTYAELKVAVQSWLKRGDILTVVDDFIDLAEADIWERLRIREMETISSTAASTSSRYLALPSDYLSMRRASLISGSNRSELQFCTPDSLSVKSGNGWPRYFTITSQIEFDRTPDSAYTVEVQYFKSLTALSASNTTNAVLTRFPMIYLYGCLMHGANWAINEELFQKYSVMFQGAIESANRLDKRGRFTPGAAMRIEGPTP